MVTALQELRAGNALIDGELVVETSFGASDFSALQADLSEGRSDRFVFYVFDLLCLDGYDLRALPLINVRSCSNGSSAVKPSLSATAAISTRTENWSCGMPAGSPLRA